MGIDEARHGKAGQGVARLGEARLGKGNFEYAERERNVQGKARRGAAGQG